MPPTPRILALCTPKQISDPHRAVPLVQTAVGRCGSPWAARGEGEPSVQVKRAHQEFGKGDADAELPPAGLRQETACGRASKGGLLSLRLCSGLAGELSPGSPFRLRSQLTTRRAAPGFSCPSWGCSEELLRCQHAQCADSVPGSPPQALRYQLRCPALPWVSGSHGSTPLAPEQGGRERAKARSKVADGAAPNTMAPSGQLRPWQTQQSGAQPGES